MTSPIFAALALGAACCMSACGPADPPPSTAGVDLLAREPDTAREAIGRIDPDLTEQWGSRSSGQWSGYTEPASRKVPAHVASLAPEAGIWLDVDEVRDRKLELHLGAPGTPGNERTPLEVVLNSVVAGTVEATSKCAKFELDAPAVLWRNGRNLLQVRVDPEAAPNGVDRFTLGPVRFGEDRRVERGSGVAVLNPETAFTVRIERRGSSGLQLEGQLAGTGRLELYIAPFVPGTAGVENSSARSWTFDSDGAAQIAESIPLDEFASDHLEIGLAFRGEPGAQATIEQLLLVERAPRPRPPVVFVAIDTLSAKHMSVYGYPRPTTPVLEAFAEDSVVFESAYSNASWTLPSFQAMLTGLYPRSHVLSPPMDAGFQPQISDRQRMVESRTTLAEAFRSGGWMTFGHFDNMFLGEVFGTRQGFDEFSLEAARIPLNDREGGIDLVRNEFFRWVDREVRDRPFFALLHCLDVHGPYAPKKRWVDVVTSVPTPLELPATLPAGGYTGSYGVVSDRTLDDDDPPPTVDPGPLVDLYDAGIAEVDNKLEALFNGLRKRGLYDKSIIVLTADHGESMVQNGIYFGHTGVFDAVTHIPLMIKLPDSARGGTRVSVPVQSVDFMPTLLELSGLDSDLEHFHGRSLVPLLEGRDLPEIPILQTHGAVEQVALRFKGAKLLLLDTHRGELPARITVRGLDTDFLAEHFPEAVGRGLNQERLDDIKERFGGLGPLNKWLWANTPRWLTQLYDLEADPGETVNVANERREVREELSTRLTEALTVAESARATETVPTSGGLSEEQVAALKAAGYLED